MTSNLSLNPISPDRAADQLTQAATAYVENKIDRPTPAEVVAAMLVIERSSKQGTVTLPEMVGTWRLAFVTGTKKTRKRAGKAIGAGRYLPAIPKITLAYRADYSGLDLEAGADLAHLALGRAVNTVAIGALKLTVTGPIEAIAGKRILAFDFTRWSVAIGDWVVSRGEIGGGVASDATFADRPLKERPFFNYFWVSDKAIAARGKGGGLAMWVKMAD
jgi:hypothetical protein